MLSLLNESISNASFGIYMPEVHGHDLRGPLGARLGRRDRLGYVGAAATKSMMLGAIILATARALRAVQSRIRSGWSRSWC